MCVRVRGVRARHAALAKTFYDQNPSFVVGLEAL